MNRRLALFATILVAFTAACSVAWYLLSRPASGAQWLGYAEADYIYVAPVLQGRLTSLAVARGDEVAAGKPLFSQDDADDLAARNQAEATLDQAKAALADLQANRDYSIAQAQADAAADQATYDQVAKDLGRNEKEESTGGVSSQTVDLLRAQTLSAQAQLQAAQAKLVLVRQSYAFAEQQAAVAVASASLTAAKWRLDQRQVVAPEAGLIADTFAEPGETLAAGGPVILFLPPQNIRVRFFVPETALALLQLGEPVAITCNSCPPDLMARISFIAAQPEYTPPVIYSQGTRGNLVYLVEARPALNQAPYLKPGQPVEVSPAPEVNTKSNSGAGAP